MVIRRDRLVFFIVLGIGGLVLIGGLFWQLLSTLEQVSSLLTSTPAIGAATATTPTPNATYTPYPTYSPYPTYTAIPLSSTRASQPTSLAQHTPHPTYTYCPTYTPHPTLAPLTDTPWPSPTPQMDTPPGTILEVGETWLQTGAEVLLKNASLNSQVGPTGVLFELHFTNRKPQDISFSYSIDSNFVALDNLGRRLKLGYMSLPYYWTCDPQTRVVRAGETTNLTCVGADSFLAEVNIGDSNVTEVIITVSGISSIYNASWRIPVYH